MRNNVKVQHTFIAATRRTVADSSNKKPGVIIGEPTAVVPGTYMERNVRLAPTCNYNAFQKKFQTANWGKIFVLLHGCLYLQFTCSCRAH